VVAILPEKIALAFKVQAIYSVRGAASLFGCHQEFLLDNKDFFVSLLLIRD